ncbi:hypothetical protein CRUP_027264, partial [Coryphaenoides rupestris]
MPYPGGRWCPLHQFQCANHLCVSASFVCDRLDDCGDASDEQPNLCRKAARPDRPGLKPCLVLFSFVADD